MTTRLQNLTTSTRPNSSKHRSAECGRSRLRLGLSSISGGSRESFQCSQHLAKEHTMIKQSFARLSLLRKVYDSLPYTYRDNEVERQLVGEIRWAPKGRVACGRFQAVPRPSLLLLCFAIWPARLVCFSCLVSFLRGIGIAGNAFFLLSRSLMCSGAPKGRVRDGLCLPAVQELDAYSHLAGCSDCFARPSLPMIANLRG